MDYAEDQEEGEEEEPCAEEMDDEDDYPPTVPDDMDEGEWGEGWAEEEEWDPYEGCNSGFPGEGRGS